MAVAAVVVMAGGEMGICTLSIQVRRTIIIIDDKVAAIKCAVTQAIILC